ncbi:MAG: hypothetical protein O3B74_02760 [Proteobacteria bacterium]|nr:hypothetical protein [Pseudomonadota bacterium]
MRISEFGKATNSKILGAAVIALTALSVAPTTADAEKRITLTVISGNTHHYAPVGTVIKAFMPKVDEILAKTGNYKVNWIQGFGGQIVKVRGELEGVQTGLGDIGVVPGPFHPSKLSLYQIGYVTPFTSLDLRTTTAAMGHLMDTYPEIDKQAQRFNQSVLGLAGTAENYAIWTTRKITRVEELKGMKIGAVGSNAAWVSSVGGVPVILKGLATVYSSLKTGVYQGSVLWQQVMAAFKFCEVTPHQLNTGFGAISNALLTVNTDSWKKMPAEVQAAVKVASKTWVGAADGATLGGAKWGEGECIKKFGQTTTFLDAEQKRKWAFAMPNLAQAWAKRQDAAGLPGTKMLGTFMDYMRAHKQVVVRNWDKE